MSDAFHLVPAASLVTQVREQIQRAITDGKLLPNQRLNEVEIAESLGVSRGPVREAARLLEQSGLLISIPRRGFFVRQFQVREIEELYELGEWVEVAAIEVAVERATIKQIAGLRAKHDQMRATAGNGDPGKLIEAILDFHREICILSGNARAVKLFDEISIEIRQMLSVLGVRLDENGNPAESRMSLIEAVENRDRERAMREMRDIARLTKLEVIESYHNRNMEED